MVIGPANVNVGVRTEFRKGRAMHRGAVLAVVVALVMAGLIGGTIQSQAQSGSPTSSPAASPEGSPVGSPMALVGDVDAGKALASQCLSCHSVDGSAMVGPTWKGLYGHEVELEDGTTVIADVEYLTESIKDPNAKVVKGFPAGAMPPYGSILTDENVLDIIAYIQSLSDEDHEDEDDD